MKNQYIRRLPVILMAVFIMVMAFSAIALRTSERRGDVGDNPQIAKILQFSRQRMPDSCIKYAHILRASSDTLKSPDEYVSALISLGQAYYMKGEIDSMDHYLTIAFRIAERTGNYIALSRLYNIRGIRHMCGDLSQVEAFRHFTRALQYASEARYEEIIPDIKCNLATMYYLRSDTSGLGYSKEIYELGVNDSDNYLIYCGALTSAYLCYLKGDQKSAMKYMDHLLRLDMAEEYNDPHEVYTLYGDLLVKEDSIAKAIRCYEYALRYYDPQDPLSGYNIFISYGRLMMDSHKYAKADSLISKGIEMASLKPMITDRYKLYYYKYRLCSLQNNYDGYRHYLGLYIKERDSLFNLEGERNIQSIRYEHQKSVYEDNIIKTRTTLKIIIAFSAFISVLFIFVIIYLKIKENTLVEAMRSKRDSFISPEAVSPKPEGHLSGNDTLRVLFNRIETLMLDENLYRDPDISRDKVAERLHTNRTYITKAVNQYTGMTFIAYINTFRIREAISLLSDKTNDTPIKAIASDLGFGSLSTFYKLFAAATGESPSKFRSNISENGNLS